MVGWATIVLSFLFFCLALSLLSVMFEVGQLYSRVEESLFGLIINFVDMSFL